MTDQDRVFDIAHPLRWWSMTAILPHFSRISLHSTWPTWYVSTTMHRVSLVMMDRALRGSMKSSSWPASSMALMRLVARVASRLTAMTAGTSQILQMRSTPSAEPMASRSLIRWPMMTTWSAALISSTRASATMRLRTLLRFSTPG